MKNENIIEDLISCSFRIVREWYEADDVFRDATVASILSAIHDTKHSCTDEKLARKIADRLFGYGEEAVIETIGEAIREQRKQKGLSQQELALKLNISQNCVHNWETGKRDVTFGNACRIAKALGIHPYEIFNMVQKKE